jgi:hypothetical protein
MFSCLGEFGWHSEPLPHFERRSLVTDMLGQPSVRNMPETLHVGAKTAAEGRELAAIMSGPSGINIARHRAETLGWGSPGAQFPRDSADCREGPRTSTWRNYWKLWTSL